MSISNPIGLSLIVTTHPANYWQKGTYGGKTAQIMGVVHAYVDQKLVKSNKLRVLFKDQNIGSRHCSTEYKHNTATTPPYRILSVRPPQQIIYSPFLSPSLLFDMPYPY
jgi:hypothetical protein